MALPISFFEQGNYSYYNIVVVIESDGQIVGRHHKSYIPDGPGYQQKFYFTPGDAGFKVSQARRGNIGVAVCWDEWFLEAARIMS